MQDRAWVSLVFTALILILSPMIQKLVGLGEAIRFSGDSYLLFALSSFVFVYGGYPFLKGLVDEVKGAITLADIIKPESRKAMSILKDMGIRCMMLTGDNKQVAQWVSREVGLDEYFAEVLPQEKTKKVKEVQSGGLIVAMTGDGVNDAPALAQADVGIAVAAGTDVAAEIADVILVRSNPLDVVATIGLARATYRKMVENLIWAADYDAIAIPLAAGVLYNSGIVLSPAVGAVLMSISTVTVAINARLLKLK